MVDHESNGWAEYQRLVLDTLERHNKLIEEVVHEVRSMSLDVALFKRAIESMDEQRVEFEVQLIDLRNRVKNLENDRSQTVGQEQGREAERDDLRQKRYWTIAALTMAAGYIPMVLWLIERKG